MRYAFNADAKQFEEFYERLMPKHEREVQQQMKVQDGISRAKRLFGG